MGGRKRSKGLTARQREWRGHLRAAARSGETIRAYAKRHGLSEQALYQAARVLRQRGVQPAGRARWEKPRPTFVRVSPAVSSYGAPAWRVRLANGVVLEGSGAVGRELVEALARL